MELIEHAKAVQRALASLPHTSAQARPGPIREQTATQSGTSSESECRNGPVPVFDFTDPGQLPLPGDQWARFVQSFLAAVDELI